MDITQQKSFLPSETNQHQFTTLNEINEIQMDCISEQGSEEGQMTRYRPKLSEPFYPQVQTNNNFYLKFFNCLESLEGEELTRYSHMQERFRKFFIVKQGLEKGQRWNRRLQPDYKDPSTFPLSNAIMIYGVDYLSNRDIRKKLGLDKNFPGVKRINWSNVVVIFQSRQQLQEKLKPIIFDKQAVSFFKPKEEQQQNQEQLLTFQDNSILNSWSKLPRQWYGLRPYQYKDQYIFWFVRYLTNIEPQYLHKIKQTTEFMETYNASKKLWERKQKTKQDFDSSMMNSSRYQTIYRSRGTRSVNGGSEPEKRERSRQKIHRQRMDIESQDLMNSNVLGNLQQQYQATPILDQSHHEQMSFVYTPQLALLSQQQSQFDLKKKSDQILGMFEMMTVNCGGKTLESVGNFRVDEEDGEDDDGMETITHTFDPKGQKDRLFFQKKSKISKLTEVKPEVKFNYSEYVEKIIEAEDENKEKNKRSIPIICLD